MALSKANTILHPIRLRILMTIENRQMTPQQIAAALPDVPQASLYRHIGTLRSAGILKVVAEKPVRGVVEKVYALPAEAAMLQPEDLASISREDHLRYFTTFMAVLLSQFRAYLQQERIDFVGDGAGYSSTPLYLSDDEFKRLRETLRTAIQPFLTNTPTPERRRRLFSAIVIPETSAPEDPGALRNGGEPDASLSDPVPDHRPAVHGHLDSPDPAPD